jgi:hypothetical protein
MKRAALLLTLSLGMTFIHFAHADTEDQLTKEANGRVAEGLDLFRAEKFEAAYAKFKQAYALSQLPKAVINLAIAELRSNRPLDGLRHLKEYVKDPRLSEKERASAQPYLEEAMLRTGHVRVEAPASLEISVSSTRIGTTPLASDVDIEADKDTDIEAAVTTPPGTAPAQAVSARKIQSVHCPAGKTVTIRFEPLPGMTMAAKTVTVVALGGLGAASLVLSGVFYAGAKSAESDANALSPKGGADYVSKRDSYDSGRALSTVFFYSGAALAAGAVVTAFVWKRSSSSETSVRVLPGVGSVGIQGAF